MTRGYREWEVLCGGVRDVLERDRSMTDPWSGKGWLLSLPRDCGSNASMGRRPMLYNVHIHQVCQGRLSFAAGMLFQRYQEEAWIGDCTGHERKIRWSQREQHSATGGLDIKPGAFSASPRGWCRKCIDLFDCKLST